MGKSKSKMLKVDPAVRNRSVLALYKRVSTDRQREEGYSLEVQEERLRHFARAMDEAAETRIYSDDGYSGASLDRPAMTRMIRDIEVGAITHVIVVKLDRLSRSQKDTLHLIEDVFIPHNVAFISIQESFNTETPFGRAMIGILSVFAQLERENIYERTRSGMRKRVESGLWAGGGHPPFGYDYDPKQGILVPNRDAEKVRYVYDQYLAGRSLQSIADDLGLVYEKAAYNILTRKTNAGYIVYNGAEFKGRHEPLVSLETYERAMELMEQRAKRRLVTKTDHLLTGLLVCGVCGARMRYQKWGPDSFRIVCYSRQRSKAYLVRDPNCDNEYADSRQVEAGVLEAVFSAAETCSENEGRILTAAGANELLASELNLEKKKLRRLYDLYGDGGDQVLLEAIDEARARIESLEKRMADKEAQDQARESLLETVQKLKTLPQLWPHMDNQERRTVLTEVVDHIEITHGDVKIFLNTNLAQA